jgi:Mrp family chromosome partitioning ATPase
MPAGTVQRGEEGVLRSETWRALVRRLRESFEFVVVEAPPVPLASDALVLTSTADEVVLTARPPRTPADEVRAARAALRRLGVEEPVLVVCGGAREAASGRESRATRRRRRRWAAAAPSLRGGG